MMRQKLKMGHVLEPDEGCTVAESDVAWPIQFSRSCITLLFLKSWSRYYALNSRLRRSVPEAKYPCGWNSTPPRLLHSYLTPFANASRCTKRDGWYGAHYDDLRPYRILSSFSVFG